MRRWFFPLVVLAFCLALPALGGWVGYRFAMRAIQEKPWKASSQVRQAVELQTKNETMAGAFAIYNMPLAGVERCYYEPPADFSKITWVGKDMPTPFVGAAPIPGPLASGKINSQQFRYARDVDMPKPANVVRVFLVGGSTAYGCGASSNDATVGGYLEKYLNQESERYGRRFEVVTAAGCGWASSQERVLVENRLAEMAPDLVVALSGHNDAFWNLHWQKNTEWFRGIQDHYYFTLANALLSSNFREEFPARLSGADEAPSAEATRDRLRRNVELSTLALRSAGAEYCFALQPIQSTTRKTRTRREDEMANHPGGGPKDQDQKQFTAYYTEFRNALGSLKTPGYSFFDLTGIFDRDGADEDLFIDRCHFGDRGYDRIARAIRDRLRPVLETRLRGRAR